MLLEKSEWQTQKRKETVNPRGYGGLQRAWIGENAQEMLKIQGILQIKEETLRNE